MVTRRFHAPMVGFAFALALGISSPAHAESCGSVGEAIQCLDAQTLVWCAGGELVTALCPQGEICAQHCAFAGGMGCVAHQDTACGEIPPAGTCTTANNVVWCDAGEVQIESCDDGTLCAWDEIHGWYDCMPAMAQTYPGKDAGQEMDTAGPGDEGAWHDGRGSFGPEDDVGPDDTAATPTVGPTPGVEQGGQAGTDEVAAQDGGLGACAGAPSQGPLVPLLALGLLTLLVSARRRSSVYTGRRPRP